MVGHLDAELWRRLDAACTGVHTLSPRETFSRAGEPLAQSALLLDGIMARYVAEPGAGQNRLMVSLQVSGDFVDLHGMPLGHLDHDVTALTQARVALFPHAALIDIMDDSPQDARALWKLTMIDAAIHRHWIYRSGRLRALAAVADFICEMDLRLQACEQVDGDRVPLPLMQTDLAEVSGLSTVHVSRVTKELRDAGLCTIRAGAAHIHDRDALRRLAGFDPSYLYLPSD